MSTGNEAASTHCSGREDEAQPGQELSRAVGLGQTRHRPAPRHRGPFLLAARPSLGRRGGPEFTRGRLSASPGRTYSRLRRPKQVPETSCASASLQGKQR